MTLEDYSQQNIPGVLRLPLKTHITNDGSFTELWRYCGNETERLQINLSEIEGRRLKAWHYHEKQIDVWIPLQRLMVGLYDPKTNIKMKFAAEVECIIIPNGVFHGVFNDSYEKRNLLYLVDRFFDPADEHREPWDYLGASFWEDSRG